MSAAAPMGGGGRRVAPATPARAAVRGHPVGAAGSGVEKLLADEPDVADVPGPSDVHAPR